jgi:O-acetyl-ADP-ribose deacetylase (regulator of RNase III)
LRIAAERGLRSIAFPAVGTGIAGYPIPECARIMVREAVEHLKKPTSLEKICFVLFDAQALSEFEKARAEMAASGDFLEAPEAGRK